MKKTSSISFRITMAVLFALGIGLSFWRFASSNEKKIAEQNGEYISELTQQDVSSLDSFLSENLTFIESVAYLYGENLTSPFADVAVIRDYERSTVFEHLRFIDASGDDYTSRGVMANLADRDYFKAGMRGESGITFVAESRVTGENQLGFYAPVPFEGKVIGVMVGFYGEAYIRKLLSFNLFGYDGKSWLLDEDGLVIGSSMESGPSANYFQFLREGKRLEGEELERVEQALRRREKVTFSYLEGEDRIIVYGLGLTEMPWTMIREFPPSATRMILDTTNEAGRSLLTSLIALFLIFGALFTVGVISELLEKQKTIRSTERDPLTGLYNRQYFYHYVDLFDQRHRNMPMDAVIIDADHFQLVNERYGRQHGDYLLKCIGERLLESIKRTDGVLCRREADIFMMYCPHREDYTELLELASVRISEDEDEGNRVRIRLGVYENVDKEIETIRRFDMAKSAAASIRGNYHRQIAYYDGVLHKKELYEDRLIGDFPEAVRGGQFLVYLQPKFDVRGDESVLAGAEALVRWQHPALGLLSPGEFIPLFESNGLIGQLDAYVWGRTARIIQEWKARFGKSLPISVNVSRVDMYNPKLTEVFGSLLRDYGLGTGDLLLEVTESAYMEDSNQIIEQVVRLREMGFRIEMDDFGTGYSSLNMISELPVDVLKLDMAFIRAAFRNGRDTRLLEIILDIAKYLNVPVIAEGVETEEQLEALRSVGCDYVQGYYFSKPLPQGEFEEEYFDMNSL